MRMKISGMNYKKCFYSVILIAAAFIFASCGNKESLSGNTASGEADTFTGSWEAYDDENILTLDIWTGEDGTYYGQISCDGEENSAFFWEFSAEYKNGALIYSDCQKTEVTYDDDGYSGEEEVYFGGSGKITLSSGKLIWKDKEEGLKYTFEYTGSY